MTTLTNQLQSGMRVRVYQRPLTDEEFEGDATLVRFHGDGVFVGLEMWFVRFDDEEGTFLRSVKTDQTTAAV